jgi:8-oxo-dGTP diphosphatase
MARAPVLAAGGIVVRQAKPPLIAVVRLRKCNEWVLPKGKLDDGETPRDAAMREVLEETGHDVSVHEFLGTLAYDLGGRSKIVHYWRMETQGRPTRELMDDIRAVDWLPLKAAVERLSREHERAFLANVGPLALEAAASARRSGERRPAALDKRRRRRPAAPKPSLTKPSLPKSSPAQAPAVAPLSEEMAAAIEMAPGIEMASAIECSSPRRDEDAIDASIPSIEMEMDQSSAEAVGSDAIGPDARPAPEHQMVVGERQGRRTNVMQWVRSWLRRPG